MAFLDDLTLSKLQLVTLLHRGKLEEALVAATELGQQIPDDNTVKEMRQ